MEIKLNYKFGSEHFTYRVFYSEVKEFLIPALVVETGESIKQVKKMLEDDKFFEKKVQEYHGDLENYFEEMAEEEYEEMLEESSRAEYDDEFNSYNDFCARRSPNLLR